MHGRAKLVKGNDDDDDESTMLFTMLVFIVFFKLALPLSFCWFNFFFTISKV